MATFAASIEETSDELCNGARTSTIGIERRVKLGNVEGDDEAGLSQHLHNQECLCISDTASHRHIDGRDKGGVYEVGIQAHMQDAALRHRVKNTPYQCNNAVLPDLTHINHVDATLLDDFVLPGVDRSGAKEEYLSRIDNLACRDR
jgi:hypothetical protein